MTRLGVPEIYRPAFEYLANMDNGTADSIIAALSAAPPANPESLYEVVSSSSSDVSLEDAEYLVDALVSLHTVRQSDSSISARRAAEDISASDDLNIDEAARANLAERLGLLLEAKCIDLMSRAHDLSSEQDKTLTNVKIVSDIRPIFGEDASRPPDGAIVAHTLRLTYWENGQFKTFSLALDSDDLRSFDEAVNRSLKIDRSLKSFLAQADLQLLDFDE